MRINFPGDSSDLCVRPVSNPITSHYRKIIGVAIMALTTGCAVPNQQPQLPTAPVTTNFTPVATKGAGPDCLPASQVTYLKVRGFQEEVAVAQDENGFLFIDKTGNPISKKRFDYANSFHNGRALVKKNNEFYYVDHQINEAQPPKDESSDTSDSAALQGNPDVNPVYREHFDYVGEFKGGLAPARVGDKWFHIRPDYSPAYKERYDRVGDFSEDLAVARIGDRWFHIGRTGKPYPNRKACSQN